MINFVMRRYGLWRCGLIVGGNGISTPLFYIWIGTKENNAEWLKREQHKLVLIKGEKNEDRTR